MQTIGLFGGTFDPPHIGHLILAAEARAEFKLDRLLWVLTLASPLKQANAITSLPHRLKMLELALADDPGFELSRVDIDRPAPFYTVDTVRLIAAQYPQAVITYLMGGDSLRDLPLWHDPAGFVAACDMIGVLRRPEDAVDMDSLEQKIPGITEKVRFMQAPLLDIAAHDIRERIARGRPFRYYLPDKVFRYIRKEGLYRMNPAPS
jgi:nicotinate-nucleotide adenylyltransferase